MGHGMETLMWSEAVRWEDKVVHVCICRVQRPQKKASRAQIGKHRHKKNSGGIQRLQDDVTKMHAWFIDGIYGLMVTYIKCDKQSRHMTEILGLILLNRHQCTRPKNKRNLIFMPGQVWSKVFGTALGFTGCSGSCSCLAPDTSDNLVREGKIRKNGPISILLPGAKSNLARLWIWETTQQCCALRPILLVQSLGKHRNK